MNEEIEKTLRDYLVNNWNIISNQNNINRPDKEIITVNIIIDEEQKI